MEKSDSTEGQYARAQKRCAPVRWDVSLLPPDPELSGPYPPIQARRALQLCSFCAQLHLTPPHSGLFQPKFAFSITLSSLWV